MVSNDTSINPGTHSGIPSAMNTGSIPSVNTDGTISAIVRALQPLPTTGAILRLWLPVAHHAGAGFGRFFLARCTEDNLEARSTEWSIYARRPLFCAGMPTAMPDQAGSLWELFIPHDADPGYRWLLRRPQDTSINLLGPFGQPFELASHARALLVIADTQTLPTTLPIIHTMLDRGGRVTLLIKGEEAAATALLPLIPIPVEVRIIPNTDWLARLNEAIRWADQLCAALPSADYAPLAHQIRSVRFQFDQNFAHILVPSDLICGVGACLACVTPTRDGNRTRTCLHGPVFPLSAIV